jgi:predicted metal-binding protein
MKLKRCRMHNTLKNYLYDNNSYDLEIKWDSFNYKDLPLNIEQVRHWCKEGCPNYNTNGGCPPFSPTASDLLKDKSFILLVCKIKTCQVVVPSLKDKIDLTQKILCSFMESLGYTVSDLYNIDFLNAGHCTACDICTIHSGCKNPKKRIYCITGSGIMLGETIEKLFEEKLQWFTETEEPLHVIKIMGFLSGNKSSFLLDELNSIIKC